MRSIVPVSQERSGARPRLLRLDSSGSGAARPKPAERANSAGGDAGHPVGLETPQEARWSMEPNLMRSYSTHSDHGYRRKLSAPSVLIRMDPMNQDAAMPQGHGAARHRKASSSRCISAKPRLLGQHLPTARYRWALRPFPALWWCRLVPFVPASFDIAHGFSTAP